MQSNKKNKFITVVILIVTIAILWAAGRYLWYKNAVRECSEVYFDFISALNSKEIDNVDKILSGETFTNYQHIHYRDFRENLIQKMETDEYDIIQTSIGSFRCSGKIVMAFVGFHYYSTEGELMSGGI